MIRESNNRAQLSKKLLCIVAILFNSSVIYSQTPTFLTGNKTGDIYATGALISLGRGNAAISGAMSQHVTGSWPLFGYWFYYANSTAMNSLSATPATLVSSRTLGIAGAVGSGGDAYVQFRNTNNDTIQGGITTYFKIGSAPTITGLSASVGGLLGLSGIYNITGAGYRNASNYVLGTTGANSHENIGVVTAGTTRTQMLIDKTGTWFVAVTPSSNYNAVRLNVALANSLNLVNLTRDMSVNVYSAYYYPASSNSGCNAVYTTPGEVGGLISLNLGSTGLLSLDSAVSNPHYAVDDDTNTYSRITSGVVGLATSITQTILFIGTGNSSDVVSMKLAIPQSALTAGVLSDLTVTAYNGSTQVGSTMSVNSLLSLDLLGLLGDNTPFYANFKPNGAFDRVSITLGNVLNVGANILGGGVRIYGMQRVAGAPLITAQPTNDTVCEGVTAILNVTSTGTSLKYQWQYKNSGSWINTGSKTTSAPLQIINPTISMDGRIYRVNVEGGSCPTLPVTYISDTAILKVKPLPHTPPVTISQ